MKLMTVCVISAALLCSPLVGAQPGPGSGNESGGPACMMSGGHAKMARGKGMRMHGRRGQMRMEMAAKLELTDDQKAKMEKLRDDFQMLMIDQQAKVRKAQIQMRQLRRDDKASVSAVEAQIDQIAKLRAESAKMRYRHHTEMRSILTDKQKEQLKEIGPRGHRGMRGEVFDGDDGDDDDSAGEIDAHAPDGEEG